MPWITAAGELYASSVQLTADFVDADDGTKFWRRSGDDYAEALANLLPQGVAWPRDPESVLMQLVAGLAQTWGLVDGRAADLLQIESDPRLTDAMLGDWERAWGLPDPCVAEPLTKGDRRLVLVGKMTFVGRQDRGFFEGYAASLGHRIHITEHAPFMCGVSACGDTRDASGDYRWEIGPPEIRFWWTVSFLEVRTTWFRCGHEGGQCGIDPMVRMSLATDLDCIFSRLKPAHTDVIFDYSGVA
ncbi:YmfQ family protein [Chelatococcus reniformis]|uniref:Tail protein n=1 Tax=Chelatococcus reniformis TaxID=1494448 RepID=A0A916UFK7_9HYPH|nr:putative phage tail protein [Chelatococcus reniformis]GGC70929.1 tail protein [Chelatococcus reniformis]